MAATLRPRGSRPIVFALVVAGLIALGAVAVGAQSKSARTPTAVISMEKGGEIVL